MRNKKVQLLALVCLRQFYVDDLVTIEEYFAHNKHPDKEMIRKKMEIVRRFNKVQKLIDEILDEL